ncbi:MAG TPA: LuxR C-terminal-related transcriptional regulator [Anaerolineales bacterium]|nr:LuxR C-terminal-related transcriptional regulator [Anaerolineales bacterium]HLO27795.1 LuxR C-terminal-related transcriptional regulator [Anaerolineales bacterium]
MAHADPKAMEAAEGTNQPIQEYREPLLSTKLFIPPVRSKRVARSGLIIRMNNSLDKTLILVSAPAGFGKTTLLAEWVAQAGLPVAWLSLDAGDNDPNRFLRYMIAALNVALANGETAICATAQSMLQSVQPLPIQTILVALINDLTSMPEPFALVLDDYQFITGPEVNEALTFILEHVPSHVHLVIASRVDPSLPLHRLRAAQRLLEIRTEDLRLTVDETSAFMNTVMELRLRAEDISILNARTEGWVVGLQMAALSMQGMTDYSAFIQGFGGSHRYILEYLIEEVLDRQAAKLQTFLLQTSVLDRLCASLCDAVLAEEYNSQAILEYLDRSNLFFTPLDQVGCWYRYHHLFANLLQAQLQHSQPELIHTLHLRASQWYEEAGLPEEAIQHAFAAKELERAAGLVERSAIDILGGGEMSSLLNLFAALPEDLVLRRPMLCVLHAWALTFAGRFEQVGPRLQQAERWFQPGETTPEARRVLGSTAILRGLVADFQGNMGSAIELALQADKLLPEENLAERSIIPFVLGDYYWDTGELDKAEQAFDRIKQIGNTSGNLWTISVALHKLALVKVMQGKLHAARDLYQEAIDLASKRGGQQYGSMGAIYVGMSDLSREWNELGTARQAVTQAIKNMEHWPNPTNLVSGYVTLARICLSQGEIELAEDALKRAEEFSNMGKIFPITRITMEACRVRLWLAKGNLAMANQWAIEKNLDDKHDLAGQKINYMRELEWIAMARLLIARGELGRALAFLTIVAQTAEASGRNGRQIEILILMTLALQSAGRTTEALNVLSKSLALAESERYMRVFLDEGRPMEELLRACNKRMDGPLKGYTQELLDAFKMLTAGQAQIPASSYPAQPLVESLTGREIEVLHLLATGLSNRQVAERLYLSEGTVKTHTHNLYAKLGVQSRTQAIARARELDLI